MENICCFLIPYFGKLPNYFHLFLKSCKYNKNYKWIIFTDDEYEYDYPDNVERMVMTFEDMKKLIQDKFDFEICIYEPHKLCDFKPAYGYIFENYIINYKFWGHCDLDIILGKLDEFITNEMIETYDKLFCLGHMVLYKNDYYINRVFMKSMDGELWYKSSFSNSETTIFDEPYNNSKNINDIFEKYGYKVLMADYSMNCYIIPNKLVKITFNSYTRKFDVESKKDALYLWDKGELYRLYLFRNRLIKERFLYIHFQLRKMTVSNGLENADIFKIMNNTFAPLEYMYVDKLNFSKIKKNNFSLRYIQIQMKWKINKFRKFLFNKRY